jgi:hypothetical protein
MPIAQEGILKQLDALITEAGKFLVIENDFDLEDAHFGKPPQLI